jgi:hypothetical protein
MGGTIRRRVMGKWMLRFDEWVMSKRGYVVHVWLLWGSGFFTGLMAGLFFGRNF